MCTGGILLNVKTLAEPLMCRVSLFCEERNEFDVQGSLSILKIIADSLLFLFIIEFSLTAYRPRNTEPSSHYTDICRNILFLLGEGYGPLALSFVTILHSFQQLK